MKKNLLKVLALACTLFLLVSAVPAAAADSQPEQPAPRQEQQKQDTEKPKKVKAVLPKHKHGAGCEKTQAEPVLLVCILDRSGSMHSLAADTIGGYNSFLAKQKAEEGKAELTTVLFDDQYEVLLERKPLAEAPELTGKDYFARGTTALLDAVGKTIMTTAGSMEKEGICPQRRKVLFMIMTDGLENASREYKREKVRDMITEAQEKYGWQFIFMGANIDSFAEAQSLGIDRKNAMNYEASGEGVQASFQQMDRAASAARGH